MRAAGAPSRAARRTSYPQVTVYRAFPLSEPGRWVVFLDRMDREIGMLGDIALLAPDSRRLCAEALHFRYLTPQVTEILEVREDVVEGGAWSPVLLWDLATPHGRLHLRLPNVHSHVRRLGERGLLLWDREGRRAEIHDVEALPPTSRRWLQRYLWM